MVPRWWRRRTVRSFRSARASSSATATSRSRWSSRTSWRIAILAHRARLDAGGVKRGAVVRSWPQRPPVSSHGERGGPARPAPASATPATIRRSRSASGASTAAMSMAACSAAAPTPRPEPRAAAIEAEIAAFPTTRRRRIGRPSWIPGTCRWNRASAAARRLTRDDRRLMPSADALRRAGAGGCRGRSPSATAGCWRCRATCPPSAMIRTAADP